MVINTWNEEENLGRALASVADLADEIVVVDMKSQDKTVAIAKKAGAKIYTHKYTSYVEPARNFALSKATGEWVLVLDADEEIPGSLAKKLKRIVEGEEGDYFRLPRKNLIFGKWMKHSRWWPDYNIRFFKKGSVKWSEVIHSVPETRGVGKDLAAVEENAIVHHHYTSVAQYVERMNRYTTIQAKGRVKKGEKFDWSDILVKPAGEFLSRYFFGKGYKDGLHGLAVTSLQAASELVLVLKVWEAGGFTGRMIDSSELVGVARGIWKDVVYWMADMKLGEGNLGKFNEVWLRIKRKLST